MSCLINRENAVSEIHKYFIEEINKTPTEIDEDGDEVYTDMPTVNSLLACNKELSKRIKALPSAKPKTGKWKTDTVYAGIRFYRCDQCDFRQSEKSRYCPSCGAKMRGEEE